MWDTFPMEEAFQLIVPVNHYSVSLLYEQQYFLSIFPSAYLDVYCKMNALSVTLHPFAYRTHTHHLGAVVSGYKIDKDTLEWHEIGRMDPR